jgi:hypothetical protein
MIIIFVLNESISDCLNPQFTKSAYCQVYIRMVINKYVDLGLTHFVLDLVGLDESTIKLVDSKIIKKL